MDSDRSLNVNPYAPTATASILPHPASGGVSLDGRQLQFSGQLTLQDVALGLGNSPVRAWAIFLIAILAIQILLLMRGIVAGRLAVSVLILLLLGMMIALFVGAATLGARRRARVMLARHPRLLEPQHGVIDSQRIRLETRHGWAELRWDSIVGIKSRDSLIALALNPQHANIIVLPQRYFAPEDWAILQPALAQLSRRLPFRARNASLGDAGRLLHGDLERLVDVPSDAILLAGTVGMRDILRSPYGRRVFVGLLRAIVPVVVVVAGLSLWMVVNNTSQGSNIVAALLWVLPLLLALRLVRLLATTFGKANAPLLKLSAAVSEEGLWMSTPKGKSFSRWSSFEDCVISDRLVMLRENSKSVQLTPLPRAALDDPNQWAPLLELVQRKIREGKVE